MPQAPRRPRPSRYRYLRLAALREQLAARHAGGESFKALAAWLADHERLHITKAALRRFIVKGKTDDHLAE